MKSKKMFVNDANMPDKLIPCPFCKGKPSIKNVEYGTAFVICDDCGAGICRVREDNDDAVKCVVKAWNRRVNLSKI